VSAPSSVDYFRYITPAAQATNHPLPVLPTEASARVRQDASALLLVVCLTLAASVLSASFCVFLVRWVCAVSADTLPPVCFFCACFPSSECQWWAHGSGLVPADHCTLLTLLSLFHDQAHNTHMHTHAHTQEHDARMLAHTQHPRHARPPTHQHARTHACAGSGPAAPRTCSWWPAPRHGCTGPQTWHGTSCSSASLQPASYCWSYGTTCRSTVAPGESAVQWPQVRAQYSGPR